MKDDFRKTSHAIKNVPKWAADAIWYQIFPERFRNGDTGNDPFVPDVPGWQIKSWSSDWYAADMWETENFGSVFKSIFYRRYGGDLQGIIDKLDYLQELGITAVYLNPVFRAPSLHKYDGICYHHIDENFGPEPVGDRKLIENAKETDDPKTWIWTSADRMFLALVKDLHRRGIKVIIDGVFNHSGRGFFAFQDILKNGRASRYISWYDIKKWDKTNPDGFEYEGWYGHKSLPEFWRDKSGFSKGYEKYLFNITRRWMSPRGKTKDGVDGWRLDVAFCIPHAFWKKWRRVVKQINPEAYTTGEVVDIAPEYLQGDEFDALMNYPFAYAVSEFFIDKKKQITASEFDRRLKTLRNAYPKPMTYAMQNLMSSHDTPRLATLIVNPDMNYRDFGAYFNKSKAANNPNYRTDRGGTDDLQTHKLIAAFQMTYVGAPMIYYGDEVNMTGANDPDCRKPMLWDDIKYEDEAAFPAAGFSRPVEKNRTNKELLEYYKKLIKLRNNNIALRRGTYKTLMADDEKGVFAFLRKYGNESVIVVFNNSDVKRKIDVKIEAGTESNKWRDMLNDSKEYIS